MPATLVGGAETPAPLVMGEGTPELAGSPRTASPLVLQLAQQTQAAANQIARGIRTFPD
jgi:hypothetical protein